MNSSSRLMGCKKKCYVLILLYFSFDVQATENVFVFGPGLQPQNIVLPARYFFINFTYIDEKSYTPVLLNKLAVEIDGKSKNNYPCRSWINKLDRKDGSFIIRYKLYESCWDMSINIYYESKHIGNSPFIIPGTVLPEQCNCPLSLETWLKNFECPESYNLVDEQLKKFDKVNMNKSLKKIINKYHKPDTISFCHYKLKGNKLYRKCYGKHIGFNMFVDNILLFLTRRANFPDMEWVFNLGDWPLVHRSEEALPVFSWCGSDDTHDIILPTYDLTESTLENMGRVSMDTLSVQGSVGRRWQERETKAVWRGRDSRLERLKLVDIAKETPTLYNVSLTNFFFFREKEAEYGPKQPHISFFSFFDYKYQINIDGTVAAYRMPYLLAGGGTILKQESPYFEHFYKQLIPWKHYIPVARNLSDLTNQVQWAIKHDGEAQTISNNARRFANEHLLPQHIICYHAVLFWEWSKKISNKITIEKDMESVAQSNYECECPQQETAHEDL